MSRLQRPIVSHSNRLDLTAVGTTRGWPLPVSGDRPISSGRCGSFPAGAMPSAEWPVVVSFIRSALLLFPPCPTSSCRTRNGQISIIDRIFSPVKWNSWSLVPNLTYCTSLLPVSLSLAVLSTLFFPVKLHHGRLESSGGPDCNIPYHALVEKVDLIQSIDAIDAVQDDPSRTTAARFRHRFSQSIETGNNRHLTGQGGPLLPRSKLNHPALKQRGKLN